LPPNSEGVLNKTEFNFNSRYNVSPNGTFPDVVDVSVTLFNVTFKITLYKQGYWESSSMKSNVRFNSTLNSNKSTSSNSSSNKVRLDFYKRVKLFEIILLRNNILDF
jgi:hypothetical protein